MKITMLVPKLEVDRTLKVILDKVVQKVGKKYIDKGTKIDVEGVKFIVGFQSKFIAETMEKEQSIAVSRWGRFLINPTRYLKVRGKELGDNSK